MQIIYLTNSNGRLACDHFIHIAKAPDNPISADRFPIPVMVQCNGEKFPCKLISIIRMNINEIPAFFTVLASGKTPKEFIVDFRKNFPKVEQVAVYMYAKENSSINFV